MSARALVAATGPYPRPRPASPRLLPALGIVGVLAGLAALSLAIGARPVPLEDILAALGGQSDTLNHSAVAKRIVRTVLALLVGAALGLSGAVMQGATRNPLGDPGLLGVNMGASLAVATCIALFGVGNATFLIWVAIAGAALTSVFVFIVGSLGRGGATPLKLALAGAATSAAALSFISAVVLTRDDIATNVQAWQIGGVGGGQWSSISQIAPFMLFGAILCLLSARSLNALALGDEMAQGLGQRLALARLGAGAGAAILCGSATAVAGPIAFVGLVVPHACRLLLGVDYRWILPFSAIAGAALLIGADILGRIVAQPDELPVGIITALVGAPVFIAIVRRHKVRAL